MSYILGTKLVFNQRVRIALTKIFGIGPEKAIKVCDQLGIGDHIKVNELTKYQIDRIIEKIIRNSFIAPADYYELQKTVHEKATQFFLRRWNSFLMSTLFPQPSNNILWNNRKKCFRKYYSGKEKKMIFQRLLNTSAHLGYRGPPTLYCKLYLYGFRHKRAIIDLEKTLLFLRIACNVIGSIIRKEGHLWLVNTDPLFHHIIEGVAGKTNQSYVNFKWIGGFLTNWEHMKHEKRFQYLSAQQKIPRFLKMQKYFKGLRQIPDCLVIMNAHKDFIAILEANQLQIPIVSLVDSTLPNRLHRLITYPIPVNNNSIQFTDIFCQLITKKVIHSKKARKLASSETTKPAAVRRR